MCGFAAVTQQAGAHQDAALGDDGVAAFIGRPLQLCTSNTHNRQIVGFRAGCSSANSQVHTGVLRTATLNLRVSGAATSALKARHIGVDSGRIEGRLAARHHAGFDTAVFF
jgi:hypothetical protein